MKNKKILTWFAMLAGASTLAIMSIVHAANLSTNLTWCTANSGSINISYTECQSLAYLYHETSGDNTWAATGNWFSNTDVSLWKGGDGTNSGNAMVISGGHIISLSLSNNNLRGSIQSGLVGLTYLSGLNLFDNSLFNVNTSGMSALRSLNIGLNVGFSGDFTHTTGLIYLNVYFNNFFSDKLSTLIAPLHNLERLYAWNNILSGGLDVSTLTNLKNLELNESSLSSIDLSNNTGLTALAINYNNLTYLDISHNPLLSYVSAEYGLLTGVKLGNPIATEMYFGSNSITSINLSGATGLQSIRVSDNQLSSINISSNLALQGLDIQNNNFTYINLTGPSLISLNAQGNQLTGINLSGVPLINYLNLSSQEGSGLTTLDISNNTLLGQLLASGNSIETIISAPAGSYGSLTVFDVSDNPLSDVTDINALSLLSSHNQYTSVGNFTGTAHDTAVSIEWTRPIDYGYSGDLYKYTARLDTGSAINISGLSTTTYVITGLTNSQSYLVTLCAVYSTTGADNAICESVTLTPELSVCQPGKTLYTGGAFPECIPCMAGTFNSLIDGACIPAPMGYFIDNSGATGATLCPPGTYGDTTGATACTPAEQGYFVPDFGSQSAIECEPGSFSNTTSASECTPATPGYFVSGYAAIEQTACGPNTFTDSAHSTSCTPCPTGYISNAGAAICVLPSSGNGGGGGGGLTSFIRNPLATIPGQLLNTVVPTITKTTQKTETKNHNMDPSVDEAYSFGFTHGLTTLAKEKARLDDGLNRFELAKMASAFLKNVLGKEPVENPLCDISKFQDYETFDSEMKVYVKKACDYGLMGWKGDKTSILDKFSPFSSVTREQFATTLYRALFPQSNEQLSSLLQELNKAGIIRNISTPDMSELRGYTLLMFQRAAAYGRNK